MRPAVLWGSLLSLLLPGHLAAQGNPAWIPEGTALGVTIDRFAIEDVALVAGTFHVTLLKPNHLTPEFGVSIFPQAFASRVLATNIDVGGALNLPLPYATLLIRGGASGIFAFGSGGAGAIPGLHYGASLLVKFGSREAIRVDVLARRAVWLPGEVSSPVVSLGFGISALPPVR
jgi:hypothetical protein